jgi:hypothetical protein
MKKTKIIAIFAVSFVVFATTLFALAQSQTNSSVFLDSDQDGLTDQQEKLIGTDPHNPDTDNDGYFDGEEAKSCYNPTKPAPGDKLTTDQCAAVQKILADPDHAQPLDLTLSSGASASSPSTSVSQASQTTQTDSNPNTTDPLTSGADSSLSVPSDTSLDPQTFSDLSSDPNNPNLTNEMVGQLLQLTKNKATTDTSFADNPTYTSSDIAQVTQGALQTVDLTKNMPDIKDSDINLLPEVKGKNLSADDIKAKQKTEIETYLSQSAFVLASNSPFSIAKPEDLQTNLNTEETNLIAALSSGDASKIDAYAQKAQTGIDQMKKIEVPYVLKDIHKSALQLALYSTSLKDQVALNSTDPMKSLAAVSSLQAVAQKSTDLQTQFSKILSDYGIDAIKFP